MDVLVLSSGGNLLDSLALALCAVLSETLLPKARCNLVNPKKNAPKKTPRIYICSKIYICYQSIKNFAEFGKGLRGDVLDV